MKIIPLAEVEVRKRQRTSISRTHVIELRESIEKVGLLHPPVCWFDEDTKTWVLVVGECRVSAIRELAKNGTTFIHADERIEPGMIAITPLREYLDEIGRFEAELAENVQREDLDWKDKASALSQLHEMRQKTNPKQSFAETGRELVQIAGPPGGKAVPEQANRRRAQQVQEAVTISRNMHIPSVASARSSSEALAHIYKHEEHRVRTALARRRMADLKSDSLVDLRRADLILALPELEAAQFDLIFADPPYGMGADSAGYKARTVIHHNYDDSPDYARVLMESIMLEGFRITKGRANLLMFFDIRFFDWLQRTSKNLGWTPFPRPLIWRKSQSEGLAPWGGQGPRLTTEYIFYATKGQRGMTASPIDVFDVPRVPRSERDHAGEKPVPLLKRLIEVTTLPGDHVLDPCCGSGSTLLACRETKRYGLGLEKDETYFALATANLYGSEECQTTEPTTEPQVQATDSGSEPVDLETLESLLSAKVGE